jgi:O-antigen/teichoic acid export membrane protein
VSPIPVSGRTLKGAAQLVLLRGGGQGLEFLGWVVLARSLGTSAFGSISIAFFAARAVGLVADWGATVQGTRAVAAGAAASEVHALSRLRLVLGVVLAAIFAGVVCLIGQPELTPLSVCILGRGASRDWLSLGGERHARSSIPSLAQGAIVLTGASIATGPGVAALTLGIAYGFAGAMSIKLNPLPARSEPSGLRLLPGWFFAISFAEQVFLTADAFLIAWLLGTQSAGIYSAVYRFPNAWMTVLGLVVVSAIPATAKRLSADRAALRAYEARAHSIGGVLAFVVLTTAPVLVLMVPVVFGSEYESGRWPLLLLLVSTAAMAYAAGYTPLYYASRSERMLAGWTISTAALNIALNLILIPRFELIGAAASTLVAQVLLSGFVVLSVRSGPQELSRN